MKDLKTLSGDSGIVMGGFLPNKRSQRRLKRNPLGPT